MRNLLLMAAMGLCLHLSPCAAAPAEADRTVINDQGILRWQDTKDEVALFGVNYYPPFHWNYRDIKALNLDAEKVIRDDVAHFKRLRLDLLRLHVFDREISDREGNLIDNDHLRLLDYLVDQCRRNGIHMVLTPIAWWSVPSPSDGFSNYFTINQMTTDPASYPAQRNYLAQFMKHRNRYTNLTYGEDPDIIAFELINEPLYPEGTTDAQVTGYINTLAEAVRDTGCRKPLFFNGWQNRLKAVAASTVDGSTFGWYPTGLVSGHPLRNNCLPTVENFSYIHSPVLEAAHKAKGIYEFDPADMPGSYMYPAMARAFRSGGAQFAAQFQYDPLPMAPFNAGWQTHYLNLIYTPQKALSFLIASEAFHNLPRSADTHFKPTLEVYTFGSAETNPPQFRVSYPEDLSEYVTPKVFLYSNTTHTTPPAPNQLERIAGSGSSAIVNYEGTGAYFVDKIGPGQWRLEVYPDAVWVDNPFGPDSLGHEVSRIYWRTWPMKLSLPDLGNNFSVRAANTGAPSKSTAAKQGQFPVSPGVYLLQNAGVPRGAATALPAGFDTSFVAPKENPNLASTIWHEVPETWISGREFPVQLTVAAPGDPQVKVHFQTTPTGTEQTIVLQRQSAYHYAGTLPARALKAGTLSYRFTVGDAKSALSFPGGIAANQINPNDSPKPYVLVEVKPDMVVPPLAIGNSPGQSSKSELADLGGGHNAIRMTATGFGEGNASGGIRLPAKALVGKESFDTLVVRARALEPATRAVELGLVQEDGSAFGYDVPLTLDWKDINIPIRALKPLWSTKALHPDLSQLKEISLIFGTWLYGERRTQPHGLEIENVRLEHQGQYYRVDVREATSPIPLFSPSQRVQLRGETGATQTTVPGKENTALRVSIPKFGPPPSSVSFRMNFDTTLRAWQPVLAQRQFLHLRIRATTPHTNAVEVVLIEDDGSPWGCEVPITNEWQDIRIPWSGLRFFNHWPGSFHRGGEGDRFHPEHIQGLNVAYGAWLFPEYANEPHAIEIEGMWLE